MKQYFTITGLIFSILIFGQVYDGSFDQKVGIAFENVKGGRGINVTYDKGVGENISLGFSGTYLLSADTFVDPITLVEEKPTAIQRLDLKARANIHLYNLLNVSEQLDIYPGINLGIKNLGVHTGVRYFFNDGIGVFSEIDFPIADFQDSDRFGYYNSFKFRIGFSLNL